MIVIKGRSTCDWTTNAILLCDIEKIEHQFINLNDPANTSVADEIRISGMSTPVIYDNERYIGGYQAFQQWLIRKNEDEIKWQVV